MAIATGSLITICSDALAVVILIFILIRSRCITKKGHENRIFTIMLIAALTDAVCNAVCYSMHGQAFKWGGAVAMSCQTLLELSLICILYYWLLFVDYMLYWSGDHLVRHYRVHFIPVLICFLVLIINPSTGILFSIGEDLRCERKLLYNLMLIIEYSYVVISLVVVFRYRRENGRLKFFRAEPMLFPLFAAIVASELTQLSFIALGFAVGLLSMYIYMGQFAKYVDEKTGFLNPSYLEYIKRLEEKGIRKKDVMIRITGEGNTKAMPAILKQELPRDAEVIQMGEGKYLLFAENKNRQFAGILKSTLYDVMEEYNRENPDAWLKLKAEIIKDKEI